MPWHVANPQGKKRQWTKTAFASAPRAHSHPPPSVGYDCIAMVSPDSLITPLIILALLALILNFIFSLSFQRREKCVQLYATSREAKVEVCMVCSTIFPMKTGDIFQSLPGIPGT